MASVPNRANPLSEYLEIRTDTLRANTVVVPTVTATTITGTSATITGTSWSGSGAVVIKSGSIQFTGFPAQGKIFKYQPVVFMTETGSGIYLSGATTRAQPGIIGVSADAYTAGQNVSIITEGLVPFQTSGSQALTRGGWVINTTSGSMLTGSTLFLVEDFSGVVGITASGSSVLGIAVITGSAGANTVAHIWVKPQLFPV